MFAFNPLNLLQSTYLNTSLTDILIDWRTVHFVHITQPLSPGSSNFAEHLLPNHLLNEPNINISDRQDSALSFLWASLFQFEFLFHCKPCGSHLLGGEQSQQDWSLNELRRHHDISAGSLFWPRSQERTLREAGQQNASVSKTCLWRSWFLLFLKLLPTALLGVRIKNIFPDWKRFQISRFPKKTGSKKESFSLAVNVAKLWKKRTKPLLLVEISQKRNPKFCFIRDTSERKCFYPQTVRHFSLIKTFVMSLCAHQSTEWSGV